MLELKRVRRILQSYNPVLLDTNGRNPAAVAMVLTEGQTGLEVLFIERAAHADDPWSGNLAFPGGRVEPEDEHARATAERESREELCLDLRHAELLGRLDDIIGAYLPVKISCFVYFLPRPSLFKLNHEIQRSFWFAVDELGNPDRHCLTSLHWHGKQRQIHGIHIDDSSPLLWGITYRLVVQFLSLLGEIDTALLAVLDD